MKYINIYIVLYIHVVVVVDLRIVKSPTTVFIQWIPFNKQMRMLVAQCIIHLDELLGILDMSVHALIEASEKQWLCK